MTVVDAVAVLLDESGSEVEELTEAVLVMVLPSLGAATRIVMGGAAPGGRVLARVQATPVLVPLQVQPAPLAPWKVTPGGSESVTLIGAAAVLGPALLNVRGEDGVAPATAGSRASAFAIERSAEPMTVVDAVAVLLDASGSEVQQLAEAVLLMVPPSLGAVTRIVMGGAAPGRRLPPRVTLFPYTTLFRSQPAPLAPWKVTPGGSESVTLIGAAAVLGPALL